MLELIAKNFVVLSCQKYFCAIYIFITLNYIFHLINEE